MANKRVNKIFRLKDISGLVELTNDNDLVDFVMIEYPKCLANSIIYKENDYVELINPFPNKPWFLRVCRTSPLKTPWEKEKLLVTSNFSFSHSVFYPFGELSATFNKFEIVVCKLFQFVVWERVKGRYDIPEVHIHNLTIRDRKNRQNVLNKLTTNKYVSIMHKKNARKSSMSPLSL